MFCYHRSENYYDRSIFSMTGSLGFFFAAAWVVSPPTAAVVAVILRCELCADLCQDPDSTSLPKRLTICFPSDAGWGECILARGHFALLPHPAPQKGSGNRSLLQKSDGKSDRSVTQIDQKAPATKRSPAKGV